MTWLLFALMWCLARLPFHLQMRIGRMAGYGLAVIPSRRRHVAAVNLALCFPGLSHAERQLLLHRHMISLGQSLVETAISWWTPTRRLLPLIKLEGLEHYQLARAQGRGVILLIGHFVHMELIGRLLALHAPLHISYRRNKNLLYDAMLRRVHGRHCSGLIAHTDLRGMYQVLADNEALWYAPDQNYAGKLSAFVPFFGVPASTITATSRIARRSGAALILVSPERLSSSQGYRIVLSAPLQGFPGEDEVADAARILGCLEQHVRKIPDQYLWVHRRFKTRPPGMPDVYRRG
ncbi:MAG: lipid A biosynthesis lauroyl acyltransferase [Gammaproteobacteria bacterium]|nr:lipid A biosynthesis lauroyl acyltransferase [Gammaproteobacteria bacterium]